MMASCHSSESHGRAFSGTACHAVFGGLLWLGRRKEEDTKTEKTRRYHSSVGRPKDSPEMNYSLRAGWRARYLAHKPPDSLGWEKMRGNILMGWKSHRAGIAHSAAWCVWRTVCWSRCKARCQDDRSRGVEASRELWSPALCEREGYLCI
jgi:hypothetical protein